MGRAGEITHQLAITERGRDHRDVVKVPGRLPWIVRDIHVFLEDIVGANVVDEVPYGFSHGVHVAGRYRHGLCQHETVVVENAGRQVSQIGRASWRERECPYV